MTNPTFDAKDLKFHLPFTLLLGGPSHSGKTEWLMKFLRYHNQLISPVPKEIVYCYGQFHQRVPYLERQGVTVHAGVPDADFLAKRKTPYLLIYDDLMMDVSEKHLADLFTRKAHHENFGLIFLTQSIFEKHLKIARTNSHYLVLMRQPSNALAIRTLATQLFPTNYRFMVDAYNKATQKPFGYILVDMHPSSHNSLRLRTCIFPNEIAKVYLPQKA